MRTLWAVAILLGLALGSAPATGLRPCTWFSLDKVNRKLQGQLVDFTHNHHHDNRFWSAALCAKRDMYVYLPPSYDSTRPYPGMLYLHGIAQDEASFQEVVQTIDCAMSSGRLPHMVIGIPDGSLRGVPTVFAAGSFYVNSRAGRFEDYIVQDVWGLLTQKFCIDPSPNRHILSGASMGGFGAFNLGIKYRENFKLVAGIFPPLHVRYLDCHGRYFANYDPNCLGIRERLAPFQAVGRFAGGLITIRESVLSRPLYGCWNGQSIQEIARENPYEMLDNFDVQPGQLQMYAGYGKKDQFNIDAQIEAFADKARCRGLDLTVVCDPQGRHDTATGLRLFPSFCCWVSERLK